MSDLAERIRAVAYLEGDFVLRSGRRSSFYLDKYRFETQPALLREQFVDVLAAAHEARHAVLHEHFRRERMAVVGRGHGGAIRPGVVHDQQVALLRRRQVARLDFAATWSAYMRRLGLTNWMVGATDATALRALLETGVPCFDLHTSLPEGEWAWGSANFHSLGPTKV